MVGRRIWAEGWVWVEDWPSAVVLPGRQPQKRHKCYAGAKSSGAVEADAWDPKESTYRVRVGLRMLKVWQQQSWRKDTSPGGLKHDARNGLGEGSIWNLLLAGI